MFNLITCGITKSVIVLPLEVIFSIWEDQCGGDDLATERNDTQNLF